MKEYLITVEVSGYHTISVSANDESEARVKAIVVSSETEYGPLSGIDYEVRHSEEA